MGGISVAVIGAGPGGICMGAGLRRIGVERFTIYEQSDDLGGTWLDSRYPGAAVDTPQPLYAFSFAPYDFPHIYASRDELLTYLHNVADRYRLRDNARLSCKVERVEWDSDAARYTVHASDGSAEHYDVVVSAVGLLNNPRYPDWPGLEDFEGIKMHSARWDAGVDLSGLDVAVVGTGSTAAQVVPALAGKVRNLHLFQRQPGWVGEKPDRERTPDERAAMLHPVRRRLLRLRQIFEYEKRLRSSRAEGTALNQRAHEACLAYITRIFGDRPDLAKLVTPDYPFGGKRPVLDSNFYPALLRDNVELVPHAVESVTRTGIVDATGMERQVDALVMCTGFQAAEVLGTFNVVGQDGRTLSEVWNGSPFAWLGLMVPGFPNFYMMYGPNTNGGPIMFFHERQAEFVLGNLRRMARTGVRALDTSPTLTRKFNEFIDRRLERMVSVRYRVHGYAFASSGREVISWGEGLSIYWLLTHALRRVSCFPVSARAASDHRTQQEEKELIQR